MRIPIIFFTACFFLFSPEIFAKDQVFRIDLKYGGTWRDAEKSKGNRDDDWLCWAASAANVLAWTGWGDSFNDEDEILQYFSSHWQDRASGSPRQAWRWWFAGIEPLRGARVIRKGGGFWKKTGFPSYKWKNRRGTLFRGIGKNHIRRKPYSLKRVLDQGYGVAIQVVRTKKGKRIDSHMITLWGYTYNGSNSFTGIFITDSDDDKKGHDARQAKNRLRYYPVQFKQGAWWFTRKGKDWKILAAYALARRSNYIKK